VKKRNILIATAVAGSLLLLNNYIGQNRTPAGSLKPSSIAKGTTLVQPAIMHEITLPGRIPIPNLKDNPLAKNREINDDLVDRLAGKVFEFNNFEEIIDELNQISDAIVLMPKRELFGVRGRTKLHRLNIDKQITYLREGNTRRNQYITLSSRKGFSDPFHNLRYKRLKISVTHNYRGVKCIYVRPIITWNSRADYDKSLSGDYCNDEVAFGLLIYDDHGKIEGEILRLGIGVGSENTYRYVEMLHETANYNLGSKSATRISEKLEEICEKLSR